MSYKWMSFLGVFLWSLSAQGWVDVSAVCQGNLGQRFDLSLSGPEEVFLEIEGMPCEGIHEINFKENHFSLELSPRGTYFLGSLTCDDRVYWWFMEEVKGVSLAGLLQIYRVPGWSTPEKVELLSEESQRRGLRISCVSGEMSLSQKDVN